jgi:hypothetical protein
MRGLQTISPKPAQKSTKRHKVGQSGTKWDKKNQTGTKKTTLAQLGPKCYTFFKLKVFKLFCKKTSKFVKTKPVFCKKAELLTIMGQCQADLPQSGIGKIACFSGTNALVWG